MEENSKQLLLKDLCARLLYGVKCIVTKSRIEEGQKGDIGKLVCICLEGVNCTGDTLFFSEFGNFKPYLFPLSSMTREQLFEVQEILGKNEIEIKDSFLHIIDSNRNTISYSEILAVLEWFYKNHFDINGLIPMGLAIDATGLNIY